MGGFRLKKEAKNEIMFQKEVNSYHMEGHHHTLHRFLDSFSKASLWAITLTYQHLTSWLGLRNVKTTLRKPITQWVVKITESKWIARGLKYGDYRTNKNLHNRINVGDDKGSNKLL